MRKVVGGNRSLAVEMGQQQQDNTLGLMHLRKLFTDFRQTQNCTQKELEEKLYCMLPLFCKVNSLIQKSNLIISGRILFNHRSFWTSVLEISVVRYLPKRFIVHSVPQVFGSSPTSDMTEKFGDILQFCSHVSRLMVGEIRRRASNQSTGTTTWWRFACLRWTWLY